MAVWVRVAELPIEYYNHTFLWRLGDRLGKTLKMDPYSKECSWSGFGPWMIPSRLGRRRPMMNKMGRQGSDGAIRSMNDGLKQKSEVDKGSRFDVLNDLECENDGVGMEDGGNEGDQGDMMMEGVVLNGVDNKEKIVKEKGRGEKARATGTLGSDSMDGMIHWGWIGKENGGNDKDKGQFSSRSLGPKRRFPRG
ncbi:Retrovirus-related Pol polyprotein LINE-1 [Senna tora]|uniref:Retrovirus-related Pol polyprotein LINE-1 n=1 Tax=Senna tora TaxID=362788 RepID=A0A835C967_9FABA|nr:Retrovirus-related Pol polyprotein LINE-1 [Senna tora]